MNVSKTTVIVIERVEIVTECDIEIGSERLAEVIEFVYLGSRLTRDGKCEGDIEKSVKVENRVNRTSYTFMGSYNVQTKGVFDCSQWRVDSNPD